MKKFKSERKKTAPTSWGPVAHWYDETVESGDSYQQTVILPNLLRLMDIKRGERVLDLACGQGFFARAFYAAGAEVIGADISAELIAIARAKSPEIPNSYAPVCVRRTGRPFAKRIHYHVAPAHALPFLMDGSVQKIALVLALQNIEKMNETLAECTRVFKPAGKLFLVLNHPAFRIPKASAWGWDENEKVQYRRIDHYLSNLKTEINMTPGSERATNTVSFHRPLQAYFKALHKEGFAVSRLEEWSSGKKSQKGPRAAAEDRARKAIPLFLAIEAIRS